MSIYELLKESETCKVDLNKKSLWLNGKQYIKDGANLTELPLIDQEEDLDALYYDYKYSVPSSKASKSYFKALPVDSLTDVQLAIGQPRYKAQAMLEGYILLAGMAGVLANVVSAGNYFWQSETDSDFVILKKWIQ